ncbi:hypothetical protein [Streptomyces sp. MUM 2J]|uniref:hypothetical protein n=1 Tax=Streptomyces sp. MUM 2J TaxID=2791987 RepID=UPI001F0353B0|nr:hypothetical protein [Streptomyces sp. MUM 2J]
MTTVPPPEHPDEEPGEGLSITDDQWEAFQRDAADEGGRNAPKEPSARARMVTRRLREQDTAGEPAAGGARRRWWRRRPPEPQPWTPPGWRTGPAWQEMNGTRARRRRAVSVVAVLAAVAVAVVAVRPSLVTDHVPGFDTASGASPSPLPPETARPSASPAGADSFKIPNRAHPFRGSPALNWADGADAVVLPPAKATAGLSKDDVARALRRVKTFLVAAELDPDVLRGAQPDKALSLLDPKDPSRLSELRRYLRDPARHSDPLSVFSRFDPHEVVPAGDVVKVRGRMTFADAGQGQLRVRADYSFVYPLVKAGADGGDDDVVARTVVRRVLTFSVADPHRWQVTPGKLWLEDWDAEFYNDECGVDDGYLHPAFPYGRPSGTQPSGEPVNPYDRSQPLRESSAPEASAGPDTVECGTTTGT